ncbi:MAG: metal-dependent transcriptional regulator [Firmicutes bacterium]|nr:metal-dependent transcriptional regulator [Bacillota bacterium]
MEEKSEFYTLVGYRKKEDNPMTEAMEDYLEMIYREHLNHKKITVKELAQQLNVKPSSVSKMIERMRIQELVTQEKYGTVFLTEKGFQFGKYLLWRHEILETFFKMVNQNDYKLELVEKIEHFIDPITLEHMKEWIKK